MIWSEADKTILRASKKLPFWVDKKIIPFAKDIILIFYLWIDAVRNKDAISLIIQKVIIPAEIAYCIVCRIILNTVILKIFCSFEDSEKIFSSKYYGWQEH